MGIPDDWLLLETGCGAGWTHLGLIRHLRGRVLYLHSLTACAAWRIITPELGIHQSIALFLGGCATRSRLQRSVTQRVCNPGHRRARHQRDLSPTFASGLRLAPPPRRQAQGPPSPCPNLWLRRRMGDRAPVLLPVSFLMQSLPPPRTLTLE